MSSARSCPETGSGSPEDSTRTAARALAPIARRRAPLPPDPSRRPPAIGLTKPLPPSPNTATSAALLDRHPPLATGASLCAPTANDQGCFGVDAAGSGPRQGTQGLADSRAPSKAQLGVKRPSRSIEMTLTQSRPRQQVSRATGSRDGLLTPEKMCAQATNLRFNTAIPWHAMTKMI